MQQSQKKDIRPGGLSPTKDAGDEEQALCDKIRPSLEQQEGKKFPVFDATKFRSQVVAGAMYYIKIDVAEPQSFIHAKIFRPLPGSNQDVTLEKYEKGHTASDEIQYIP
ncbi:stefin-C-like [Pomacea canaliculata]|uniref:stefin-C-like n=1 Tax=Pomacea canaliculata TaxID=400727 RepID=UPI000D7285A0|nr:stefin-C-like [Pomacea canaliculata]AYH91716.1 cystatin-A-like protein [Pomacea canaliculata]